MKATYRTCRFLAHVVARSLFSFRVVHQERLIEEGPAVLAVNHASFLDPPLVGVACRREIYFLARSNLLHVPLLGTLLPHLNVVPVDVGGRDRSALKKLVTLLRDGKRVLLFPEGSRTEDGNLQDAKPGIGLVIAKTRPPIVPMRLFGTREALPRNSKWPHPIPITLVVGEPLRFAAEDLSPPGKATYQALSDRIMQAIADIRLEENAPPN